MTDLTPSRFDHRTILLFLTADDASDLADLANSLVGFDLIDFNVDFRGWIVNRILQFESLHAMQGWLLVDAIYNPEPEPAPKKKPAQKATRKK